MSSKKCLICGKPLARPEGAETDWSPFCSERCRSIDLGRWLDERYRIGTAMPADRPENLDDEQP